MCFNMFKNFDCRHHMNDWDIFNKFMIQCRTRDIFAYGFILKFEAYGAHLAVLSRGRGGVKNNV